MSPTASAQDDTATPPKPRGGRPRIELGISNGELIRRYQAGQSIRQIAAALGVSYQVLRRRLHELGVAMRPGGGRSPSGTDIPAAELVRRYEAGQSALQLAQALGRDRAGILRRLKAAGARMRPPGRPPKPPAEEAP